MSSNHLGLRSVSKSLVASCACVCGLSSNARFQRVRLQRETGSSPARKRVRLQIRNWFRNPEKRTETRGKISVKLDFK